MSGTHPNINRKMPVKGGYRKSEEASYCHGGPAGSELPPPLTCCRCRCGAEPKRVDGVLKLTCECKR